MSVTFFFCPEASQFRVMPHRVKSPGSIAKRKAAREGKQRTGSVTGNIVELAKVPIEVELAKVPRESDSAELVKVPVDDKEPEEELAKVPCVVKNAEIEKVSCDSEVAELVKVPCDHEQAELEKVPRGEEPEIEERILKASIKSQKHEDSEACWFWIKSKIPLGINVVLCLCYHRPELIHLGSSLLCRSEGVHDVRVKKKKCNDCLPGRRCRPRG